MKPFLAALLCALGTLAAAQDALVFIRPERAGPQIPLDIDPHPIWVVWGEPADANGLNRLLEPVTGYSWYAPTRDFVLSTAKGKPVLDAAPRWDRMGIFWARERVLGPSFALQPLANGAFPPYATPLAASVSGINVGRADVTLAEASNWDEVAAIARVRRRTLVFEYPPEGRPYAHLWLFGPGWPTGVPTQGPIPGLWSATQAGKLLQHPEIAHWRSDVPRRIALRWAKARDEEFGFLRLATGVLFFIGLLAGLRAMATERTGFGAKAVLRLALLLPPCAFLAGILAAGFGPEFTLPLLGVSLMLATAIERLAQRWWGSWAPWFSVALTGLLVCFPIAPPWSIFAQTPGVALGVYGAALAAFLSAGPEPPSPWTWLGRAALVLMGLGLMGTDLTTRPLTLLWLGGACALTNEGWLAGRREVVALLALAGLVGGLFQHPVFVWDGLLDYLDEAGRPNLFETVRTIASPLFLVVLTSALVGLVFMEGYARNRLRQTVRSEPRLNGLWQFAWLSLPLFTLAPELSAAPLVLMASAAMITLLASLEEG